MGRRIKNTGGFTLVEVLCAFLILALSASLLFTGIGAAGSLNQAAKESQQTFYFELSAAEGQTGTGEEAVAHFYTIDASGTVSAVSFSDKRVLAYAADSGALRSYRLP